MKRQRLQTLLRHDLNLFAYHLPLDVHPRLGNNAQLAERLQLRVAGGLEPDNPLSVGLHGGLPEVMTAAELAAYIEDRLGREVMHIGDPGGRDRDPCLVYRRGPELHRAGRGAGGGCLPERRNFRADGAFCPRNRDALFRLWPPCHRALRGTGGG
jgi:putative NIF3 family GTP cyclohydrolase 1 type 2